MKKIAVVVAIVLIAVVPATLFVWHFIQQRQATYGSADITILAYGLETPGLTVTFQPPNETAYFCPGVRFGTHGPSVRFERPGGRDSTTYYYEYVRSPVGRTEQVDIKAESKKDGSLSITFPFFDGKWEKGDRVAWFDPKGNRCGSFECSGPEQSKSIRANH
jgi:hypothetical protein